MCLNDPKSTHARITRSRPRAMRWKATLLLLALLAFEGWGTMPALAEVKRFPPRFSCVCERGTRLYELGMTAYEERSQRMTVVGLQVRKEYYTWGDQTKLVEPDSCHGVSVYINHITVYGSYENFYLKRSGYIGELRSPCDFSFRIPRNTWEPPLLSFTRRDKSYEFVYGENSLSAAEMLLRFGPAASTQRAQTSQAQVTSNPRDAISPEDPASGSLSPHGARPNPYPELVRTAWVLARRELVGHRLELKDEKVGSPRVVPGKGRQKVIAGQLGQIESVSDGIAVVRFYSGGRIADYGNSRRASNSSFDMQRRYKRIGSRKDEFYTHKMIDILQVPLSGIMEINDYLDLMGTDRTGGDETEDKRLDKQRGEDDQDYKQYKTGKY